MILKEKLKKKGPNMKAECKLRAEKRKKFLQENPQKLCNPHFNGSKKKTVKRKNCVKIFLAGKKKKKLDYKIIMNNVFLSFLFFSLILTKNNQGQQGERKEEPRGAYVFVGSEDGPRSPST